jgi:DNA repair protein RadC
MSGGLKDRGTGPGQPALFPETDLRAGHRQRLKERFAAGGAEALPDYELLELVLFTAIPRRDTKPVAKRLIERFGSFAEVVNAPPERLKEVKGIGEAAITQLKLVRACALRLVQGDILQRPVLTSWNAVLDYCRLAMGFEAREQFRVLFLDRTSIGLRRAAHSSS